MSNQDKLKKIILSEMYSYLEEEGVDEAFGQEAIGRLASRLGGKFSQNRRTKKAKKGRKREVKAIERKIADLEGTRSESGKVVNFLVDDLASAIDKVSKKANKAGRWAVDKAGIDGDSFRELGSLVNDLSRRMPALRKELPREINSGIDNQLMDLKEKLADIDPSHPYAERKQDPFSGPNDPFQSEPEPESAPEPEPEPAPSRSPRSSSQQASLRRQAQQALGRGGKGRPSIGNVRKQVSGFDDDGLEVPKVPQNRKRRPTRRPSKAKPGDAFANDDVINRKVQRTRESLHTAIQETADEMGLTLEELDAILSEEGGDGGGGGDMSSAGAVDNFGGSFARAGGRGGMRDKDGKRPTGLTNQGGGPSIIMEDD